MMGSTFVWRYLTSWSADSKGFLLTGCAFLGLLLNLGLGHLGATVGVRAVAVALWANRRGCLGVSATVSVKTAGTRGVGVGNSSVNSGCITSGSEVTCSPSRRCWFVNGSGGVGGVSSQVLDQVIQLLYTAGYLGLFIVFVPLIYHSLHSTRHSFLQGGSQEKWTWLMGVLLSFSLAVLFICAITNTINSDCKYTFIKEELDNRNGSNGSNSMETTINLLSKFYSSSINWNSSKMQWLVLNLNPIVPSKIKAIFIKSRQYTWLYVLTNNVAYHLNQSEGVFIFIQEPQCNESWLVNSFWQEKLTDRPDSIIGTTPTCLDPLITINCKIATLIIIWINSTPSLWNQ